MDNKPSVLVVEDDVGIGSFIETILTSNGYSVLRASGGRQALMLLTSHCPELMILDLSLIHISFVCRRWEAGAQRARSGCLGSGGPWRTQAVQTKPALRRSVPARGAGQGRCRPVSYTHLDVYKRQI